MSFACIHRAVAGVLPGLVVAVLAGCSPAPSEPESASLALSGATASVTGEAPRQLGLCASCHGRDGISTAANAPDLAGRDRDELLAAMQAYLDGTRLYPPMRAMLGPISPAERERLAQWYADQAKPAGGKG